ncbi:GNAT family N-acetyltransferase [Hymenobacter sp. RP-2-7]|uniref:GNAT family N-acetyltransferase n=1 Tax=Hymenobacter polaris TaxID=2682546 RepID=A0A7Y0AC79_9BACT|nr:GNAT family N-acetyltransferase [Hymenobacter polaris]NML64653.1 GNAT family N-acetyltransferase [Hymenobacter polaris]
MSLPAPFVTLAATEQDLAGILALQAQNLPGAVPAETQAREGFLTLRYTLGQLQLMHAAAPSVVARVGTRIVGYALAAVPVVRPQVPQLESLFALAETIPYRGRPLAAQAYYLMGQVCVAAGFRGLGLFDQLYHCHRATYGPQYQVLVTDIAARNTRSLRAHERVGFQPLTRFHEPATSQEWVVVAWDWR